MARPFVHHIWHVNQISVICFLWLQYVLVQYCILIDAFLTQAQTNIGSVLHLIKNIQFYHTKLGILNHHFPFGKTIVSGVCAEMQFGETFSKPLIYTLKVTNDLMDSWLGFKHRLSKHFSPSIWTRFASSFFDQTEHFLTNYNVEENIKEVVSRICLICLFFEKEGHFTIICYKIILVLKCSVIL